MTSHRRRAVLLRAAHRSTQGAPVRCQAPLHCQTGTAAATHSSTIAPHTQPGDPTHVAVREQGRGAVVPREVGRALPRQPLPVPGQIPQARQKPRAPPRARVPGTLPRGRPAFPWGRHLESRPPMPPAPPRAPTPGRRRPTQPVRRASSARLRMSHRGRTPLSWQRRAHRLRGAAASRRHPPVPARAARVEPRGDPGGGGTIEPEFK